MSGLPKHPYLYENREECAFPGCTMWAAKGKAYCHGCKNRVRSGRLTWVR